MILSTFIKPSWTSIFLFFLKLEEIYIYLYICILHTHGHEQKKSFLAFSSHKESQLKFIATKNKKVLLHFSLLFFASKLHVKSPSITFYSPCYGIGVR